MKKPKSWHLVLAIIWTIPLAIFLFKGEFLEVKSPFGLVIYIGSAILVIAGATLMIIGIGQGIRKITVILTNKTSIVSRLVERIGKWFLYADKNRDLPTGFYYLLLGLIFLIASYLLMGFLFSYLRF